MVVKNRQSGESAGPLIPEVRFNAPDSVPAGVEVLTLAALRRNACAGSIAAAHRPDFHHLLLLESGSLPLMVDFASYLLLPGDWLWVRPGQVHRWDELAGAEGTLVLFEAGFPDPATSAAARLDDPFGPTVLRAADRGADGGVADGAVPSGGVADGGVADGGVADGAVPSGGLADGAAARRALDHLDQEFRSLRDGAALRASGANGAAAPLPPDAHLAVLRHLLAALLLRLAHTGAKGGGCDTPDAFLRFRNAVERDFARTRRVDDYARDLGYSPRTLARASLTATGVGAKEFIDRRVVLEAKRLLAHSDRSAAGVATALGFRDAANFGKFFQQRVGVSPLAFRATAHGGTAHGGTAHGGTA